jgi:cysteinyl-tRNA synthetase
MEVIVRSIASRRDDARKLRDFELADRLRDGLLELGVEIHDSPTGTEFTIPEKLDLARLEALVATQ